MKKYIVWAAKVPGNRIIEANSPWDAAVSVVKEFCVKVSDVTEAIKNKLENDEEGTPVDEAMQLKRIYKKTPMTPYVYVRPVGRIKNPEKYDFPEDDQHKIKSFSVAHVMQDLGFFGDFSFFTDESKEDGTKND